MLKIKKYKDLDCKVLYMEQEDMFFEDLDSLTDFLNECDNNYNISSSIHTCLFMPFSLNLHDVIRNMADEFDYEDFDSDIMERVNGLEELELALGKFNESNQYKGFYEVNFLESIDIKSELEYVDGKYKIKEI